MKKILALSLASCLMLTSCATFYGGGAMGAGTMGGALLGGALGGLIGGPRGHDIGTIVGGLSGLAAGTSIEVARQKRMESLQRLGEYEQYEQEDRSRDFQHNRERRAVTQQPAEVHYTPISVRNVQLVDQNDDRAFNRNETCTLIFEIRNNSPEVVRNIQLEVVELEDNDHIKNPPLPPIKILKPKQVLRYTAQIYADNRLKEGTARFAILASIDGGAPLNLVEFTAPTKK